MRDSPLAIEELWHILLQTYELKFHHNVNSNNSKTTTTTAHNSVCVCVRVRPPWMHGHVHGQSVAPIQATYVVRIAFALLAILPKSFILTDSAHYFV